MPPVQATATLLLMLRIASQVDHSLGDKATFATTIALGELSITMAGANR
jgi:hypothetical protein